MVINSKQNHYNLITSVVKFFPIPNRNIPPET